MKQNKNQFKVKTILFFCALFLGYRTYTEVPFTWMKDIYAVTSPQYQHLSPINGMAWSEQQIVENMYRYGNPQDATIKLIKEIFYLQADNVSFRPTILKSKPPSYWKPKDIGSIIRVITAYREDTTQEHEKNPLLINALTSIMQPQRNAMEKTQKDIATRLTTLKETVQDIAQQNKKLDSLMRQTQRTTPITAQDAEEKIAKITNLEEKQQFLTGLRKTLEHEINKISYESKAIDHALQTGIPELISYFIQSIKESSPDKTQSYVSYTTEQILLTLLWKIANPRDGETPKQDFVDFFNELSAMTNATHLKNWIIAEPYSKQNYEQVQQQLNALQEKNRTKFILQNYEQTILAIKGYSVWESPMPPIITGAQVTYIHPQGKQTEQFSDCVETAFRNFSNIASYNPMTSTFDLQPLIHNTQPTTNNLKVEPNKPFINFYQKNPSVLNMQASQLYNAWTQVVENLSGVVYIEPINLTPNERFYNIKSSLPNMLKICNHLLFSNNPTFDQLTREQQLDVLCKTLSHDNFTLTWEIADENNQKNTLSKTDYVKLRFFINETNSFEWHIDEGHSVIPQIDNATYPNREDIARTLLDYLNGTMPILLEPYTLLAMCKPNILDDNVNLIFLQPLHEAEDKINRINLLSQKSIDNTSIQPILIQLFKSLAHTEFYEDSARDAASIIWENATNQTSPFFDVASDLLKTIPNPLINSFLIRYIVNNKAGFWYDLAKKKFEIITDNDALARIIKSVVNTKLTTWYDLAKKKFGAMTNDIALTRVIRSVLNTKLNTWYDLTKQKFETITKPVALVHAIQAIIYNKVEPWYAIAQQKFETITDNYPASELITFIINQQATSWYPIAQQKFKNLLEEKETILDENSIETDIYPLADVINTVIENEAWAWSDVVKEKFKSMTNENALAEVILFIVTHKNYELSSIARQKFEKLQDKKNITTIINAITKQTLKNKFDFYLCEPWYKAALKKAKEIGNNAKVQQLETLIESLKIKNQKL